jgi:hypothetical protein
MMTADQNRRVVEAIKETTAKLAKEKTYPSHLIKNDMVEFYEGHLIKLYGMIRGEVSA